MVEYGADTSELVPHAVDERAVATLHKPPTVEKLADASMAFWRPPTIVAEQPQFIFKLPPPTTPLKQVARFCSPPPIVVLLLDARLH